jgi:hypothetical protein
MRPPSSRTYATGPAPRRRQASRPESDWDDNPAFDERDESAEFPTWKSWDDDERGYARREPDRWRAVDGAERGYGGKRAQSPWNDANDGWDNNWDGSSQWPDLQDERGDQGRSLAGRASERSGAGRSFAGWSETSRHWAVVHKKRLLSTRRGRIIAAVLLACLALTVLSGIPGTVFAFAQFRLAHDALDHMHNAEADAKILSRNPFSTQAIADARAELVAAHNDFSQINSSLQFIPGVAQVVPIAGPKLAGVDRLMPIALEGTQAAITGCDALSILASGLKNPLDPNAKGLTPQSMAQLAQYVDQLVPTFNTMVGQINALQPSDLSLYPSLAPALAGFRANLPKITQAVQSAQALAHLAPALLGVGQPSKYLVEVLDSTELRPGGGFIGNNGTLTLNGGRLSDLQVKDVDLLDYDAKYGNLYIPLPKQSTWFASLIGKWGFRDSNLEADFPTDAQYAEQTYATEVQYKHQTPDTFQGVIAITPWLIQNAMKITGNIDVTDYPSPGQKVTVTPDNLVSKIHYYALGAAGGPDTVYDPRCGSSERKCFTGLLFKAFMAKMKQDLSGNFSKYAQLFTDSIHSKDIQIYLNAKSGESALQQFNFASTIQAPPTGDSLFEVDANIGGSKANYVLSYVMSDQITLDASGTATHHLTVTYKRNQVSLTEIYAAVGAYNTRYHSYSRVYLPPSAVIKSQSGWVNPGSETAFGRKELHGTTLVNFDQTPFTVSLAWTVPKAATHDASGWHYNLLWEKQAGITWQVHVQLSLPSCSKITGTPQGFTNTSAHGASVNETLENDVQFALDYTLC